MNTDLKPWLSGCLSALPVFRSVCDGVAPFRRLVTALLVGSALAWAPCLHAQTASPQSPVPAVVGSPALDRLQADLDAQRKALQDLEARTRAQAEVRKAALSALQSELDTRRQADERATAEERARLSAASAAVSAAQGRVEQERQRLAAVEAERARLAEQAEKLRQEQEVRRQAEAAKPVIPPGTEKRVALVMGNARYADRPLRNPVNDSALMARTLQALGFDVQVANDVDRRGMLTALRDFENRARGADVALFYFAGHGAQVGGINYLIPVNAGIRVENDVPDEAIDAASVLRRIEDTRVKVGLMVLDACRDNPFPGASRSGARGLARMSVPTSTIVAYATAPGSTADDGAGDNGTYTTALAKYLATPGLDVKEIFDRTAQEVERVTNGKQRPREEIGLRGRFVLRDGAGSSGLASATPLPQGQASGINLSDLAREQQVREVWADWQRRMQADFESVGLLKAPDLRVQAWQRFLLAWKDDNPTTADDDRLRAQAQQLLVETQREVQAPQRARAREEQRLSEQAGMSFEKDIIGKWTYDVNVPVEDGDASEKYSMRCISEYFSNKSVNHECGFTVTQIGTKEHGTFRIEGTIYSSGEWSVYDRTLLDKTVDGRIEISEVVENDEIVTDEEKIEAFSKFFTQMILKGEVSSQVTTAFDGKKWVFYSEIDGQKVSVTATRKGR